jgi:hypothetical protein
MSITINKAILSEKAILSQINYKEYPECMFAILAACLPASEGTELRRVAGKVVFRSEDKYGNTYRNGLLHSFDDMPALRTEELDMVQELNMTQEEWYKNGKRHRDGDKPALVSRKREEWWVNGKHHREGDLPAVVDDQSKFWYKNGILHREGDLPAAVNGGNQIWSKYGKFHREGDKPAIILGDRQEWWVNGKRHRDGDRPAIIDPDLDQQEWWTDGVLISELQ